MKRVVAVIAAVGMVALAVLARSALDNNAGNSSDGGRGPGGITLACISELADVCRTLADEHQELTVVVEEADTTLRALTSATFEPTRAEIDGWLTLAPFPEMVDGQRSRSGLGQVLGEPGGPLARSPVVMVAWNDRRQAFEATCPEAQITWRCLGDLSGDPWTAAGGQAAWGAVKPGHSLPDRTAVGLLALAEATNSWFGNADYASNDFGDPAFRAWFSKLERGIPSFPTPPRTPLDEMLSKGPATFDIGADTEAAATRIERSRDKDRLTVLYPSPLATADVVLAPIAGSDGEDRVRKLLDADSVSTAFTDAGWRVGDNTLPAENGLPRAGVLEALRALWVEVVR